MGALSFWAAFRRHAAFESHAFDLGIFTNALWNLTHRHGFYSSVKGGISLFADHQSPIFVGMAPLFWWNPSPLSLLALQSLGLALGAVPVYFLARQFTARAAGAGWLAWASVILYWAYLPVRNAMQFDFHPEVFMLPLFLSAIAGFQSTREFARRFAWVFLVAALMAKESAGPIAVGVGLSWLLGAAPNHARAFTRRVAWAWIGLGFAFFVVDLKFVPAWAGASSYAYASLYSQYGGGWIDVVLSPLTHPAIFISQLLGPSRLEFLFWTLAPLAFAPLWNPRAWLAFLPGYLMLFLSAGDHRVDIHWHYGIEPAVGLFFALPSALLFWNSSRVSRAVPWILVTATLLTYGKPELVRGWRYQPTAHMRWLSEELLPAVDAEIPIAATESLVPHLSTRFWVERVDYLWQSTAVQPVCAIYDSSLSNWPMEGADEARLLGLLSAPPWRLAYECGTTRVWASGEARCLTREPGCY